MLKLTIYQSPQDLKEKWRGVEYFREEYRGYIYVCECGNAVKIGQTGKPVIRISTHRTNAKIYGENAVGRIAVTSSTSFHKEFEHFLHLHFANKRRDVRGEFFDVSFDAVVQFIHRTLQESFCNFLFTTEQ